MKRTTTLFFLLLNLIVHFTQAQEKHPRLFLTEQRLDEIRQAAQVPRSHHAQAMQLLKAKLAQYDLSLFGASRKNSNYARAYLVECAGFMYQLTKEQKYADMAYQAITEIYDKNDSGERLPHVGYGLSRSTIGLGLAFGYDWCYDGWTEEQRAYVKSKIHIALDAWPTFQHGNLNTKDQASNWVAVCRGGELVLMLAAQQETARADRFQFLKSSLQKHIQNAYGNLGFSQEGIGYTDYAGIFLCRAVFALESIGDQSLKGFYDKAWWKWVMYAGSFMDADSKSRSTFLQSGVAGVGATNAGWASMLIKNVPADKLPYYLYFYDRHVGVLSPPPLEDRFECRRSGIVWAMLYYPEKVKAINPSRKPDFKSVADTRAGLYLFRNRWRDRNDVLVSVMADKHQHSNAWDQVEALQFTMIGLNRYFIGGPSKFRSPDMFSTLLVDDKVVSGKKVARTTGREVFYKPDAKGGGYVIVNGGDKYADLGVKNVDRHVMVNFKTRAATCFISTLDDIQSDSLHNYTYNLHIGDQNNIRAMIGPVEDSIPTFILKGTNNAQIKGWVISPNPVSLKVKNFKVTQKTVAAEEAINAQTNGTALQIHSQAANQKIWIVMALANHAIQEAERTGNGMQTILKYDNASFGFDEETNRIWHKEEVGAKPQRVSKSVKHKKRSKKSKRSRKGRRRRR